MKIRVLINRRENTDWGKIVTLDLEEYVKGVVPAEMYPTDHENAIRAQAIAARTFALYHIGQNKTQDYDVDDTTTYQAYRPSQRTVRSDTIVSQTSKVYMTYNGQIVNAVYCHSNGGRTYSAKERWGNDIAYLVSKKDDFNQETKDGHGVGLSQTGARNRAAAGQSYQEILMFYYKDIVINEG